MKGTINLSVAFIVANRREETPSKTHMDLVAFECRYAKIVSYNHVVTTNESHAFQVMIVIVSLFEYGKTAPLVSRHCVWLRCCMAYQQSISVRGLSRWMANEA